LGDKEDKMNINDDLDLIGEPHVPELSRGHLIAIRRLSIPVPPELTRKPKNGSHSRPKRGRHPKSKKKKKGTLKKKK
jgi:hypothetical protein